ncbi:MAG: Clp protease N-terminal domain-containing protein [Hyphomicrobiaceae bacterium]
MAGFAEELRRIPMSQGLGATLARAADYAQAQLHGEVALEHLLLALTEDDDAAQVLAASHVDLALLKADVSLYLGGLTGGGDANNIALASDLKRILEAAAAAASQGRRREINGAIVLAAIVGDGRSSAAHMLRSQGLTFEEAIKALQRALAVTPPPAQGRPAVATPVAGKPEAEDILATARARVQTRAAPGMPAVAPRLEPVVVPAVEVARGPEPVAAPKAEPVAAVQPEPVAEMSVVHSAWPPEVRTSEAFGAAKKVAVVDFDAVQAEIEAERYRAAEDAAAFQPADAAISYDQAYEDAPHAGVTDYAGADRYAPSAQDAPHLPMPLPPMLPPLAAIPPPTPGRYGPPPVQPSPGSRWPAPVAPAWKEQQDNAYRAAEEARLLPPPALAPGFDMGHASSPPPPPLPQVAPDWEPRGPHGAFHEPHPGWPEADRHRQQTGGYEQAHEHGHQRLDGRGEPDFRNHFPPPPSWPADAVTNGHGYVQADDQRSNYGVGGEPLNYEPSWPHQEPVQDWAEAGEGPAEYGQHASPPQLPVMLPMPEAGLAAPEQPAPRVRRRKSSGKSSAGHMGESIPRKMRAHVASSVDVALTKAELLALLDGLSEETDYGVEAGCLSVKLRALDGQFVIDPVAPETQWAEIDAGFGTSDSVSWRWTVTPLKSGRRRLQLVVSARTPSVEGPAIVTVLPEQIINVRVGKNFGRGFVRLAGWIVIAAIGGLIAKYGLPLLDPAIAALMKVLK